MQSLLFHGREIPVHFGTSPDGATARVATDSLIFKNWFNNIDPEFEVSKITITQVDFRGQNPTAENVLFVRLRVLTAKSPREQIVELRGHTSAMLVNLICDDDDSIHTVLVKQSRPATGKFEYIEIPAGMVDSGSFQGAAAREIAEELNISFGESELVDMSAQVPSGANGFHLSPGLLDERCKIYLAERKVSREQLDAMQNRTTGVAGEGEFIRLMIVPLRELSRHTCDMKSLLACALYYDRRTLE